PIPNSESATGDVEAAVRIGRSRKIAGRVVFPDGRAAAGVQVHLSSAKVDGGSWGTTRPSDGEGRFEFDDLPAGEYELKVAASEEGEFAAASKIARGDVSVTLTLAGGAGPRRLVVLVVAPAGKPVPAAKASYSYSNARMSGSMPRDVKAGR